MMSKFPEELGFLMRTKVEAGKNCGLSVILGFNTRIIGEFGNRICKSVLQIVAV